MPTTPTDTATVTTTTTTTVVDMATVANDHTNTTPTENLIAGVGGHGNSTQSYPLANPQDAVVPALPPPPHVNRTHHNNIVTNATLPTARSPRASPTPVNNSPRAPPKGISPVNNADTDNTSEDLMSFESISSQLIAAANHIPFPANNPYSINNEIPPLSADNKSHVHSSGQHSLLHSHVNTTATNTANSNPQTVDDLIVLDTLKAKDVLKMKQESGATKDLIGPFEQDMIILDSNNHSNDKSNPHPGRVMDTSHSHSVGVVTGITTNQLAPANTNAHWTWQSASQQHLNTAMASHKSSNQMQVGQLTYRNGFGVSQSDVLCVEAMQMWAKAEMSLAEGDKAVGLLAYQRVSGEHYYKIIINIFTFLATTILQQHIPYYITGFFTAH